MHSKYSFGILAMATLAVLGIVIATQAAQAVPLEDVVAGIAETEMAMPVSAGGGKGGGNGGHGVKGGNHGVKGGNHGVKGGQSKAQPQRRPGLPRNYRGWTRYCWFPSYGCYGYYSPDDNAWYYWYGPENQYRPVSDMQMYPPDNSVNKEPPLPPGATAVK
jgi:hypothetical protein